MKTNFEMVRDFMLACDQQVNTLPGFPEQAIVNLRTKLIDEENGELKEAVNANDIVGVADALTDILYVVYGAGHAYGIDLDMCFQEVHNSNMSKLGDDGKAIKNEYGKVTKGPNYNPPNLERVLFS